MCWNKVLQRVPWLLKQRWNDLLFMHVPVSPNELLDFIPEGLELDTYEGQAWITIIPFKVTKMRLRKTPPVPFTHTFLEINVRTYVKRNHLSGVYFFSLDANSLPVVLGSRLATLPYYKANMKMKKKKGIIEFASKRKRAEHAKFKIQYEPYHSSYFPKTNSLNYWLLERYYLWTYRNNNLYQGVIHHHPWKIYDVDVCLEVQSMLQPFLENIITGSPHFSYAQSKEMVFCSIKKVK